MNEGRTSSSSWSRWTLVVVVVDLVLGRGKGVLVSFLSGLKRRRWRRRWKGWEASGEV